MMTLTERESRVRLENYVEPGTETRPVSFARVPDHAPILVDVPDTAIGKKFIFPVEKRKEYHEARKAMRKTHQEASLSGDYFLAIRCGTADGCIDLHFRQGIQLCREIHGSDVISAWKSELHEVDF